MFLRKVAWFDRLQAVICWKIVLESGDEVQSPWMDKQRQWLWQNYRNTRGSQKVTGILWHLRFGAPWVRTAWTVCYRSFVRASFVETARCGSEEVAAAGPVVSAARYRTEPHITQPPHSPDLALSDFWLFPTLKLGLKETRLATTEDIKSNATTELRKIKKKVAFRRCFEQL
jgi:hypothetical protein